MRWYSKVTQIFELTLYQRSNIKLKFESWSEAKRNLVENESILGKNMTTAHYSGCLKKILILAIFIVLIILWQFLLSEHFKPYFSLEILNFKVKAWIRQILPNLDLIVVCKVNYQLSVSMIILDVSYWK